MLTKKTLLVGAIMASLGAGTLGIGTTFAAEIAPRERGMAALAEAIAERFDLDVDEVQAVLDEEAESHREEMRAQHEQAFEDRLAEAVESGELTQEQADLILEKRDEMKAYAETLVDLEPQERKDAMQEQMEELKDWAEENDIPMEYLRFGPGPRGAHGAHMGQGGMNRPGPQR